MSPSLGDTSRGLKANINFYVFRIVSGNLGHKKNAVRHKIVRRLIYAI